MFTIAAVIVFAVGAILWSTKSIGNVICKILLGVMAAWGLWILCGSPRIHAP